MNLSQGSEISISDPRSGSKLIPKNDSFHPKAFHRVSMGRFDCLKAYGNQGNADSGDFGYQ
jgi:hypothetical protein